MIKLVVTDMDGTLLHDHATSVNPEYFPVIRKLRKREFISAQQAEGSMTVSGGCLIR